MTIKPNSFFDFSGKDGVEFFKVHESISIEVGSVNHFLELFFCDIFSKVYSYSSQVLDWNVVSLFVIIKREYF